MLFVLIIVSFVILALVSSWCLFDDCKYCKDCEYDWIEWRTLSEHLPLRNRPSTRLGYVTGVWAGDLAHINTKAA